ncbi:alpha/beta hydrolase [Streptomyces sp. NPDC054770]
MALNQLSVQPGAALMAATFDQGTLVTPPAGFAATARTVTETRVPVAVGDAPAAHLDVFEPKGTAAAPRPVILWVHGGGFVTGSAARVADYAIMLAHAGYTVASLDYSLAPGSRYPVPVRQADAALRYPHTDAARYGGDPARIVLGGDSAGAQIAGQLAAVQTDPSLARSLGLTAAVPASALRGVVLFCGIYDMRTVGASDFPALRTFLWPYTGSRDWTSYPEIDQLSTVRHVTAQYPPTSPPPPPPTPKADPCPPCPNGTTPHPRVTPAAPRVWRGGPAGACSPWSAWPSRTWLWCTAGSERSAGKRVLSRPTPLTLKPLEIP